MLFTISYQLKDRKHQRVDYIIPTDTEDGERGEQSVARKIWELLCKTKKVNGETIHQAALCYGGRLAGEKENIVMEYRVIETLDKNGVLHVRENPEPVKKISEEPDEIDVETN